MDQWQLPVVVTMLLTWLSAPSPSLADLARREAVRREMMPKATQTLADDGLPGGSLPLVYVPVSTSGEETPPATTGAAAAGAPAGAAPAQGEAAGAPHDQQWWHDRITQARDALDRDKMLADAVQGRINSLTTDYVNRDDPAQKAVVEINRQKALAELDRLQKQIGDDQKAIDDIEMDAHRQGIPPGWIR